jgi:hypothetical protein
MAKLSKEVLAEIVLIFFKGLAGEKDASAALRELDLIDQDGELQLSTDYIASHPRETDWTEPS